MTTRVLCDPYNRHVLQTTREWILSGHQVHLFHVISTWGSAPRHAGAMLALRDDGRVEGSVSGGCVEDDLIYQAQHQQLPHQITCLIYGKDRTDAQRWGLPCGGSLRLLCEPVHDLTWINEILSVLTQHQKVRRIVNLQSGEVTVRKLNGVTDNLVDLELTAQSYAVNLGPDWRMLIIGAGQLSRLLVPIAQACGFAVTICDPREEYRSTWMDPSCAWIHDMPDDAVDKFKADAQSAILCLSHDPKLDDMALLTALKSSAFYIGALGSLRNSQARRERLRLFDLSDQEIQRLHAPIGIDLQSKIPAEIAVAIMAQIIQIKNRSVQPANLAWTFEDGQESIRASSCLIKTV